MSDLHAVATGDVIGSSELSADERRRLPERLRRAYATARDAAPDALPYDLAIVGGDGWPCSVEDPSQALSRVLHFWTHLCANGLRSRFAVAVNTVNFIPDGNLNESDGAAFRQSGRALETLDDDRWTVCVLPELASITGSIAADSAFELVDLLLPEWTEAQAQAVAGHRHRATRHATGRCRRVVASPDYPSVGQSSPPACQVVASGAHGVTLRPAYRGDCR